MKNNLKILAICQEDPEYILGGMGRHVRELYKFMAEREDVEIDLFTSGPEEGSKEYLGYMKHHSDKFVCYKPKSANMTSLLLGDIQLIKTLMKHVNCGKKWDVMHIHEWNSFQIGKLASESLNLPLVGTMHLCISKLMQDAQLPTDHRLEYTEEDIYLMQQECHIVTQCDEFILCSDAYEEIIREIFMTKRNINVIYNGIDLGYWENLKHDDTFFYVESKLDTARPYALFVGRIADMKGIRPLLEAIESEDNGYRILLAGEVNANTEEEKEKWDVTRKIKRLEDQFPKRVKWLGFKSDEELKAIFSFVDVGIMPSIHEPFGIVALEFMANGIPLISTEVDGLGEIVIDEKGNEYSLIINANSSQQINQALAFLKDNKKAKKELKKLGLERVKDFDWNKIVDQTIEVYKRAIYKRRKIKNVA